MRREDFVVGAPGRLVGTVENAVAFVPHPLPPEFLWTSELATALSVADRELGRLGGVGTQLPNPHLLIEPFLQREAVLSSRIEGTQAGLTDLHRFRLSPEAEQEVADAREVQNYVDALELGLQRVNELPLSLRLIREIHAKLMTGVRGAERAPGDFRRVQNWIGRPGCALVEATFVPPPVPEMTEALHRLEAYFHSPPTLPPLIRLALMHYQFEAIHPFVDGNGRVGRLLITFSLCAEKLLTQPLLYLSAYFEARRDEYYQQLLAVSRNGAWYSWLLFFLRGVAEQANDARLRAGKLLTLREEFRRRLQARRGSARALDLVDRLFRYPYFNVAVVRKALSVSFPGAQQLVDKLAAAGIVREVTGKRRGRVYVSDEIVHAIEEEM